MISAISAALNPSTSNSSSAARWLPGRCWHAATNASSTLSRSRWSVSGVVGHGPSQDTSASGASPTTALSLAGPKSIGRARRPRASTTSRHVRVATVCSHERSELRPT